MERDEVPDDRQPDERREGRDDREGTRRDDGAVVTHELGSGDPREDAAEREREEGSEGDRHGSLGFDGAPGGAGDALSQAMLLSRARSMDPKRVRELLESVQRGETSVGDAVTELRDLPFTDLGYASVDHHRALRQGAPEVIFGSGKTAQQIVGIARELARTGQNVLVTRLEEEKAREVCGAMPELEYRATARVATLEQVPAPAARHARRWRW